MAKKVLSFRVEDPVIVLIDTVVKRRMKERDLGEWLLNRIKDWAEKEGLNPEYYKTQAQLLRIEAEKMDVRAEEVKLQAEQVKELEPKPEPEQPVKAERPKPEPLTIKRFVSWVVMMNPEQRTGFLTDPSRIAEMEVLHITPEEVLELVAREEAVAHDDY